MALKLPSNANFVAAASDRLVWQSDSPSSALHFADLNTGTDVAVPLPQGWEPPSENYPPSLASFDPTGQQLALTLDRVNSSGNAVAENLSSSTSRPRRYG
jgi:hypothetical protein